MRRGTIGLAVTIAAFLGSTQAVAADPASPRAEAPADAQSPRAVLDEGNGRSARYSTGWISLEGMTESTAMLRSVPVADGVDFGVGLFSVVGASEKELVRRRTDPAPDVRTRERKVPAVGMSLRF